MTTHILDPNRVNELEPSEGDERNKVMLSPFAIPRSVSVDFDGGRVSAIRFQYSGGEQGQGPEPLDARNDPEVVVRISMPTEKVLELTFSPPVRILDLTGVAERLETCAARILSKAKRLSYRMTASILPELARLTGDLPETA